MRNRLTIAFSLLLVLALPLLVLSFLQAKQSYIRHGLEARLEKGLQQTLFISKNDWKPHDSHEVWVGEKLFDVKDITATADGFIVTGVFDEDETAVLQQIQNTCARQTAGDTPVFAQFFQLLQSFFFHETGAVTLLAERPAKHFQNPIAPLPLCHKTTLTPPPQPRS